MTKESMININYIIIVFFILALIKILSYPTSKQSAEELCESKGYSTGMIKENNRSTGMIRVQCSPMPKPPYKFTHKHNYGKKKGSK